MRTPVQALETNGKAARQASNGAKAKLQPNTAAIFRLERVLSSVAPELGAAWMASYSTSLKTRALRVGGAMLGVPGRMIGADPTQSTRVTWMGLEGLSRDRVEVLGEQFAHDRIIPKFRTRPLALLEDARRRDDRIVLLSSSISEIAEHVAKALKVDTLVCNHLEYRGSDAEGPRATGRLLDPVIHGTSGAKWLKTWAREQEVDLSQSSAYGGLAEDTALLASVGKPCAVWPDRGLRASADSLDWPTIK